MRCRKRPSGRYERGTRKGTWSQTEVGFNAALAAKNDTIKAMASEIEAQDREIAGLKMQLAASRAVALGWESKWRRDNPSAPSNSETSDESWEPPAHLAGRPGRPTAHAG